MSQTFYKNKYTRSVAEIEQIEKVRKRLFIDNDNKEGPECQRKKESITLNLLCSNNEEYAENPTVHLHSPPPIVENYIVCPDSNVLELQNTNNTNTPTNDKISRKRLRRPENWKRNILKKKREAGEEYCNIKGNICPAKVVKTGCENNCIHKCSTKFTFQDREDTKNCFYSFSDAQKYKFYKNFTCRIVKGRKRTNAEESRRKYSFQYFFLKNDQKERVCQKFFCSTLDISARRIHYFYTKLENQPMQMVPTPSKGKHVKKKTDEHKIEEVKNHIKSFPTQESHFCRANTKRQYLDRNLNITKMYSLYVETHKEPVKDNIYRKVFNENFNLAFHRPKKDACDVCWEFKAQKNPSTDQKNKYDDHIKRKEEGNAERERDRQLNDTTAVITFDLENIFTLPKANVSCFFYTCKLTVYNLTAHCNVNKTATNATWDETRNGRNGDDIASALIKILNAIVHDLPDTINKLILWSDSCVPQNKNSHMSVALINFLQSNESKNITAITQKFSEPGHGNVQEVDAVHSLIERNLRHQEIYSPLALMRAFLKIKSKTLTIKFLQMFDDDFHWYHEEAVKFGFNQIPYSKVKSITYTKSDWKILQYKTSFEGNTTAIDITVNKIQILSEVCIKPPKNTMSKKKIQDIRSAYKYMPADDKEYMEAIIRKVLKQQRFPSLSPSLRQKQNKKNQKVTISKQKTKH